MPPIIRNYAEVETATSTDWTLARQPLLAQDDRYDYDKTAKGQLPSESQRLLSLGRQRRLRLDPRRTFWKFASSQQHNQ